MREPISTTAWRIQALPEARLAEAWPLIRLRYRDWTLDKWLTEARSWLAEEGSAGVVAAENDSGYIYAVCGYQIDTDEYGQPELALRVVANVGWRGATDPLGPLLTALDGVARRHDCVRMRADGSVVAAAGETARWEQLGYRWLGVDLRKMLNRATEMAQSEYRSVP
jgi:hypothetical protein